MTCLGSLCMVDPHQIIIPNWHIEQPLYARHCARCWKLQSRGDKSTLSRPTTISSSRLGKLLPAPGPVPFSGTHLRPHPHLTPALYSNAELELMGWGWGECLQLENWCHKKWVQSPPKISEQRLREPKAPTMGRGGRQGHEDKRNQMVPTTELLHLWVPTASTHQSPSQARPLYHPVLLPPSHPAPFDFWVLCALWWQILDTAAHS